MSRSTLRLAAVAIVAVFVVPTSACGARPPAETASPSCAGCSRAPARPPTRPATRSIGVDGLAVAVPRAWRQTAQPLCEGPRHPSYYLAEHVSEVVPCPAEPAGYRPASDLELGAGPTPTMLGRRAEDVARRHRGDGRLLVVRRLCARGVCTVTFEVAGRRFATATLVGAQRRLAAGLAASVRVIAPGRTSVPLWPIVAVPARSGATAYRPMRVRGYLRVLRAAALHGAAAAPDTPSTPPACSL